MLGKINYIERQVDAGGQRTIILTATDYPYGNYQVLPWDDSNRDKIIAHFGEGMTFGRVDGRDDFAVIIIGGSVKVDITQETVLAVAQALKEACQQAAEWWNEHHPLPVDYTTLNITVVSAEEIKKHPTYHGADPAPIPEDYFNAWKQANPNHDPYAHMKIQPLKK